LSQRVINPHIKESSLRGSTAYSAALHLALFLLFTVGTGFLPSPEPYRLGLGPGGGQGGDFVSVGLAAEVGGGSGMYKPPITPRPDSAPPPEPPKPSNATEAEEPAAEVFQEAKKKVTKKAQEVPPQSSKQPPPSEVKNRTGLVPREPDPGKGPSAGGSGSGGGFGGGRGVSIGSGHGEGNIDSWYIRQVERRVGRNWLQASLGKLEDSVEATVSFEVQNSGQITNIHFEHRSGIRSVDIAVERAILASNPLPPLPYEFRGRTVRFRAVFEYPPR
jgi:TonB family protein